jgi:hypothetical protein
MVAYGVQWPDGLVCVRWLGEHASLTVWASIEDAKRIHGHNGDTRFEWA